MEACSGNCTTLLGLPNDLLAQCLPDHKGSCITACHASRKLLLANLHGTAARVLGFTETLGDWGSEPACAQARVQKLLQLYPTLHKLVLIFNEKEPSSFASLQQAFFSVPAGVEQSTAWLQHITHLTIHNKDHDQVVTSLVSPAVTMACPCLTHITLQGLWLYIKQDSGPVHLPQLQQLCMGLKCGVSDPVAFQQQLQALPNLRDFTCTAREISTAQICTAIADAVSAQLTRVQFRAVYGLLCPNDVAHVPKLLSKAYPELQKLELPDFIAVDDASLDALLQYAPQLRSISVHTFKLQSSYSSRQCSWETVQMCVVDVQSLSHLPLNKVTCLVASSRQEHADTSSVKAPLEVHVPTIQLARTGQGLAVDLRITAEAVAAVQGCGGIHASCDKGIKVRIAVFRPLHRGPSIDERQIFVATLPMLHQVSMLTLPQMHINEEVLRALGQLSSCTQLMFPSKCKFKDGVWPHVLPSLPRVRKLRVHNMCITDENLLALCRAATQPVDLVVGQEGMLIDLARNTWTRKASSASNNLVTIQWDRSEPTLLCNRS